MDTIIGDATNPMTLHKYMYAEGDPVNKTDPTGNNTLSRALILPAITWEAVVIAGDKHSLRRVLAEPSFRHWAWLS
jgi:hypothetical protein